MELKYKTLDEYSTAFCEFCGVFAGQYIYKRMLLCKTCWYQQNYMEYWNEEGSIRLLHMREQNAEKTSLFFGNEFDAK